MRIVFVTGMSGAGKTTALKIFEDMGYYCIDNMPIVLMSKFVELAVESADIDKVALGIDIRNGHNIDQINKVVTELKGSHRVEVCFLESADDVLVKRYKETRRSHPLAIGKSNIEITTKGKDLSLFISGTYNFATENADMEVLGLLSRKISTMFGPIGNLSINTLFNVIPWIDLSKDSPAIEKINKIPGFEISNKAYRKFLAVIKGNINGDNYVTNFSWIN